LKLKYGKLLSNVAFHCNLRHYNQAHQWRLQDLQRWGGAG